MKMRCLLSEKLANVSKISESHIRSQCKGIGDSDAVSDDSNISMSTVMSLYDMEKNGPITLVISEKIP